MRNDHIEIEKLDRFKHKRRNKLAVGQNPHILDPKSSQKRSPTGRNVLRANMTYTMVRLQSAARIGIKNAENVQRHSPQR